MRETEASGKSKNIVLVVGCRRSGTTLVRTILEGHPQLLVHRDEPQFFLELFGLFGLGNICGSMAIEHVSQHPYCEPSVTPEALAKDPIPHNLPLLVERYLGVWDGGCGGRDNRRQLVLKDPALVFHLDAAQKLFPESTVIHVVRDPRANVSSQRRRWPQFSVWTCAMHWRRAVRAGRRWGRAHPQQYVEIQYESLVQEPEASIRSLCQALSLGFDESLLSFAHREPIYESGTEVGTEVFTRPSASRLDLWKEWLSRDDVQLIEISCAQEMAWWHYEPALRNNLSLALRTRLVKESAAHYFYRSGRTIKHCLRRLRAQLLLRVRGHLCSR